jgi:PilZ domain
MDTYSRMNIPGDSLSGTVSRNLLKPLVISAPLCWSLPCSKWLWRMQMLNTPKSSSERRQHPRYPFTGTLEAFELASQTRMQGRTADLSEGGCYVDTMSPFPAETRVRVRITRAQRSFESQATVVYSVAGMGMGLRFEATEPQQLVSLRKWVSELSGESSTEAATEEKENSAGGVPARDAVLNELIIELMRKGVVAEGKGRGMLQRLASAA